MTTTMPITLELQTQSAKEVVDITERVEALIGGATGGSCHLFLKHTTAGLMVVTNESGVPEDIMDILQTLTPPIAFRHDSRAHVAAHFLSALVGPSVTCRYGTASSPSASSSGSCSWSSRGREGVRSRCASSLTPERADAPRSH